MTITNAVEIKTYTGAQIVLKTLKSLGVDTVFGYPGSAILSLYDELYNQNEIKHYLTRHEQSAVHAAEGYARVTDKCGVVFVTSGPGATNTVTGIANAYLDGYPLIIITGQVHKDLLGTGAFQEVDILDITKSCTKTGYRVTEIKTLQSSLKDAFNCAMSGKKGPVVIDISKNVFEENCELKPDLLYSENSFDIKENVLVNILEEIKKSRNPVIVAGGGVIHSNASNELNTLAKLLNIPVVTTMMGIGSITDENNCHIGMIGAFGDKYANSIIRKSDLILSLGARFNDKVISCFDNGKFQGKFIQIDINEKEISKVISAEISVVSDIKYFLSKMIEATRINGIKISDTEIQKDTSCNNVIEAPKSDKLLSEKVIKELYELTKDISPIIVTEVGQHQISTVTNYKFARARQLITSGGSGTMGFGLPAAIGASIATGGNQPIICIAGDGSFQMNEQELATIRDYNLPIKIFIMNNGYLGMIRQLQQKEYNSRYCQTKLFNPDFVKLAEAYNIPSAKVFTRNELRNVINQALSSNSPYIADIIIEPFETV